MMIAPRADQEFCAENVCTILREAFGPKVGPTGIDLTPTRHWPEGAANEMLSRLQAVVPTIISDMINEAEEFARQNATSSPQNVFADVTDTGSLRGTC